MKSSLERAHDVLEHLLSTIHENPDILRDLGYDMRKLADCITETGTIPLNTMSRCASNHLFEANAIHLGMTERDSALVKWYFEDPYRRRSEEKEWLFEHFSYVSESSKS